MDNGTGNHGMAREVTTRWPDDLMLYVVRCKCMREGASTVSMDEAYSALGVAHVAAEMAAEESAA